MILECYMSGTAHSPIYNYYIDGQEQQSRMMPPPRTQDDFCKSCWKTHAVGRTSCNSAP